MWMTAIAEIIFYTGNINSILVKSYLVGESCFSRQDLKVCEGLQITDVFEEFDYFELATRVLLYFLKVV